MYMLLQDSPLYLPPSPTISSPVDTTLSVSMTKIARGRSVASRSVAPSKLSAFSAGSSPTHSPDTLPMSVTLTPSPHPASPRAPPDPSIRESLWAPETDDTHESSILAAFPSVQSISFPEPQDISYHSIHRLCIYFSRAEPTACDR